MTLLFSVEMVLADYRDDDKDRSRKEKRESRVKDSQEKGEIPTASAVNQAIAIHGSNRAAAKALNISESTLYRIKGQNSN
jgi:transcriptional regulator with PAS, ATPase and Fis domain